MRQKNQYQQGGDSDPAPHHSVWSNSDWASSDRHNMRAGFTHRRHSRRSDSSIGWSDESLATEARPAGDCLTVTLGDYVDRGQDLAVCWIAWPVNPFPTRSWRLRGNHEVLLRRFCAIRPPRTSGAPRRARDLAILRLPVASVMIGRDYREAAAALRRPCRGSSRVPRVAEDIVDGRSYSVPRPACVRYCSGAPGGR